MKELLDRYGIKSSPVIRRALEEEVKRCMLSEVEEKAKELSRRFLIYLMRKLLGLYVRIGRGGSYCIFLMQVQS